MQLISNVLFSEITEISAAGVHHKYNTKYGLKSELDLFWSDVNTFTLVMCIANEKPCCCRLQKTRVKLVVIKCNRLDYHLIRWTCECNEE